GPRRTRGTHPPARRANRRSRGFRSARRSPRARHPPRAARPRRARASSSSGSGGRGGRRLGKLERTFLPAPRRDQRGECRRGGEGAYHPRIMTETDFHLAVDAVLARVETALEPHDALDVDLEGGVLTVGCPDA